MSTKVLQPTTRFRHWLATLALMAATLPALAGPQFVVAVHGYDPVAYFTDGRPMPGDLRYTHSWNGATWVFSSEENRDRFAADPNAFAPQYDGHCAYAASLGYVAPADPQVWRIVDRRLYLNFSARARELWELDIAGNIAKADENWPRLNAH